jgi:hypothetical protein
MEKMCAIWQMLISPADETKACEKCHSKFHVECWDENGGCATYGCENAPAAVKDPGEELERRSFWGAKTKSCPMCGEILEVYAEKCKYCNESFEDVEPMTREEFKTKRTGRPGLIKENKGAVKVFIFGLLAITAPFNLFIGGKWYKENKEKLKEESPLHNLLAVIGLTVSAIYTFLIFIGILF